MSTDSVTQKRPPGRADRRRRGRTRLAILLGILGLVVLVVVAGAIDSLVYAGKVHAGVRAGGVALGGLTKDEATAALTRSLAAGQDVAIKLTSGDRSFTITPGDVGASLDVTAAVTAAMEVTRKGNFVVDGFRRFGLYLHGKDVTVTAGVDSTKMAAALEKVAEQIDLPPVSAGLRVVDGQVAVVSGQKGNVVDEAALQKALEPLLLAFRPATLEVPMRVTDPAVVADDTAQAVTTATTMIAGPIKLKWEDHSWTLAPDDLAAYLDFTSEQNNGVSTLVTFLSASKMSEFLAKVAKAVDVKPVDASFKGDGNKAWVMAGKTGQVLDEEATVQALTEAALRSSGRTATVAVKQVQPDLIATEAEAMGIKEKLASWVINHWGVEERQQNIRMTTKYAEKILAPGEIYNFDKQIGPRTKERGFMPAPGIVGEGNLEDVLGGGICQVATTLFNAVFEAGLEVVERHNHTLYFEHYPAGRDATVTTDAKNFMFRNDTDHYIWIHGSSDGIKVTFTIYGTKDGRTVKSTFSGWTHGAERTVEKVVDPKLGKGETEVQRAGQSARSCTVTRLVTMPDGTVLHQGPETYKSIYPMITRIIAVSPADAPASSTSTTAGDFSDATDATEQ